MKQWTGLSFAMTFVVSWYFRIDLFITSKTHVEHVAKSDDLRLEPSP